MTSEQSAPDNTLTASGEENGNTLVFRSLKSIPDGSEQASYPYLITIYWSYEPAANGGMPDAATNEAQIDFENALSHLDCREYSHLMLVVTGNGNKEWHWYVTDVDIWMEQLNAALAEKIAYPIEIENSQQADWSLYHNFIAAVEHS